MNFYLTSYIVRKSPIKMQIFWMEEQEQKSFFFFS